MRALGVLIVVLGACTGQNPTPVWPLAAADQTIDASPSPTNTTAIEQWLPAGLYFRPFNHAGRCDGCAEPGWVVATGPYATAAEATNAAGRSSGLPVGYPWVARAIDLGLEREELRGLVVVVGMFEERAVAEAVATSTLGAGAEVHALVSDEIYEVRSATPSQRDQSWLVQIEDGEAVPAYDEATTHRLLNLDELDGKGETSAAVARHLPPGAWDADAWVRAMRLALSEQPSVCSVASNSVHVEAAPPSVARPDAFAPVRCPDGRQAFVLYSDTRLNATIRRTASGTYELIQPALIECDRGFDHVWSYGRSGRTPR